MRNGKLVVAQIGCGKFAEHEDLPNISSLDTVLLKWVCDLDRKRAEEMKEQFNAEKVTSDFKEICADPEVDLIKIATSHEIHFPIVECAAAAGKHIPASIMTIKNNNPVFLIIAIILYRSIASSKAHLHQKNIIKQR